MATSPVNVLVIQADEFRWDCLGAAGNGEIRTPHLDRLAASGVRYPNAFCAHPVCTPSRYSMLSGLYPHQHGGWTTRSTLRSTVETFPRALRGAGYRTAAVGKMHFTPTRLDVGYDTMLLAEQDGPGRYQDDYHRELRAHHLAPIRDLIDQEQQHRGQAPQGYWDTFGAQVSDLPEEWHSTTWIGDRAVAQIESWDPAAAYLLHVSFIKPHHPFDPSQSWLEDYDPERLSLPRGWTEEIPTQDRQFQPGYFDNDRLTPSSLRWVVAHYYASITQLDHQVGRLLNIVERRGLAERTMVVFTADHGEYLGFHHQLLKGCRWLYDPLIRVPLLIRYPGGRPDVDERLVSHLDLSATIAAVTGVALASPGPGVVIPDSDRSFVVTEAMDGRAAAVRTSRYKLIRTGGGATDACYDLSTDPYELDDVLADPACARLVQQLDALLLREVFLRHPAPTYQDPTAALAGPAHHGSRIESARGYFDEAVRFQQPTLRWSRSTLLPSDTPIEE